MPGQFRAARMSDNRRVTWRNVLRWAGSGLLAVLLIGLAWRSATDSVDFPIYYQAGTQVLQRDYDLYPPEVYTGATVVAGHGFRYAPAMAFFFVPFALLPIQIAAFLFFCLKAAAFVHAFVIVARRLGIPKEWRSLAVAAFLVTGGYLLEDFRGGNVQFVVGYLMLLAFDRAESGEVLLPALSLAVAIAAKVTPLALLGYLALRQRWSVVLAALAFVAALTEGPAMVWGSATNKHLLSGFVAYSATSMTTPETARNYSLRGALIKYRPFGISDQTASRIWMGMLGATAVGAVVLMRRPSPMPFGPDLEFALLLTAIPLLSPHSQRIYFSSLSLAVGIIYGLLRKRAVPYRSLLITALALTMAASTVLPLVLASKRLSRAYLDFSPYTFATLILVAALAYVTTRVKEPRTP
jgi:alpha-1,2-mannosyltransferase